MRQATVSGRRRPPRPGVLARLKPRVVTVLAAIPEGRVTTYGMIAKRLRATARQVARILGTLAPEESAQLPWYRVVAANGIVSSMKLGSVGRKQVERLGAEGVAVTLRHKVVNFDEVAWRPK